jgi:peptidoglycan/LPS O-acetylase OafA/YrhL
MADEQFFTTIFSSPLGQAVLVFVLVFTIVFAILQKSKILGDGKKQIDALVALSISLLAIGAGYAMNLITKLAPFLSVSLVIILVFLIITAFFFKAEFDIGHGLRIAFGIVAFIAVVIAVLYITDSFGTIADFFTSSKSIVGNLLLLVVVVVAIWLALRKDESGGSGK